MVKEVSSFELSASYSQLQLCHAGPFAVQVTLHFVMVQTEDTLYAIMYGQVKVGTSKTKTLASY
jgi:hypothetical protein